MLAFHSFLLHTTSSVTHTLQQKAISIPKLLKMLILRPQKQTNTEKTDKTDKTQRELLDIRARHSGAVWTKH